MPATEKYEAKVWFQTPEPVGRPGYTGYIPGSGSKRLFQFGKTYGRMTRDLFVEHPVAGLRLADMIDYRKGLDKKLEQEVFTWKHEISSENNKLNRNMVSGYTGYIPRRKFLPGKAFDDECREAIASFERMKILNQK